MYRYGLIFYLLLIALLGNAQSLKLSYNQKQLDPDATIVRTGSADSIEMTTWMLIKNISDHQIMVQAKKVELELAKGAAGSICWAGYCYQPSIYESLHPLKLDPDSSRVGCFAHFTPGGGIGQSVVRWVYFDRDNPTDSVCVTIQYITYPSSLERMSTRLSLATPFPNPAHQSTRIGFSLPAEASANLVIRTLEGKIIQKVQIHAWQESATVNTENLPSGVYLCCLEFDGRIAATVRLVVEHDHL